MKGEFLKGDIKDVCAELEAEAKRRKKMTVGEWLKLRAIKRGETKQFGVPVEVCRGCVK